jgi:teichuronic acid biosynthesis glycosyltransferase TuaC
VLYFCVEGKGLLGYGRAAHHLSSFLKRRPVDIVHAHYTLSGWAAVLARPKQPIVLSLMGTDAYGAYVGVNRISFFSRYLILLTFLIQPFVSSIICKSEHIQSFVYLRKKSHVIPNGILLGEIAYHEKGFRSELGLDLDKKYVLFLGNKKNRRKNYRLAEMAVQLIKSDEIQLLAPYPIPHDEVVRYLNSVNAVVVPSLMEGSPNVVKEAMACNCPVVATNVGDIAWLFGDTEGYYLSSFDAKDMAKKIQLALHFSETQGPTSGRARIIELGLDSVTIARRIIGVYNSLLYENGR